MDLTFDNLGEAADLERGLWPGDAPLGQHPSVRVALPRLLDELDRHDLRATFFVEAINAEHYPEAVRELDARGHEVAMHGWRHEPWATLDAARERELLHRGRDAFARLGLDVRGFRPPGGALSARGDAPLRDAGLGWTSCADAGERPFRWPRVDAYHRLDSFAGHRANRGDDPASADPETTADRLLAGLGAGDRLVLHPFLMADDAGWAAARRVIATAAQHRREDAPHA